uniref:Uncharacterized protein n=1 Tax=Panagrolaimus davidi TaxID=227884 RepID=A0A914PDV0_9BILA
MPLRSMDSTEGSGSVRLARWRKRRKLLQKSKGVSTSDVETLIVPNEGNTLSQPPQDRSRKSSVGIVTGEVELESDTSSDSQEECEVCRQEGCFSEKIRKTYPPISAYIGTSATVCHMMKEKRKLCCLQIDKGIL